MAEERDAIAIRVGNETPQLIELNQLQLLSLPLPSHRITKPLTTARERAFFEKKEKVIMKILLFI